VADGPPRLAEDKRRQLLSEYASAYVSQALLVAADNHAIVEAVQHALAARVQ
jgi:hypothetical protein